MNNFSFLTLPSVLGLAAGVVYGVMAQYANLPISLAEHFAVSPHAFHHRSY